MTYKMYLSFDEVLPETDFVFVVPDTVAPDQKARKKFASSKKHMISDLGFEKTVPHIKAGVTEAELRTILECAMLEADRKGNLSIRSWHPAGGLPILTGQRQIR